MALSRRHFLSGTAALLAAPGVVFAQAATERRFIFVIQRGAADGLNIVVPYADPAYARQRGALAIDPAAALKLDGTFALHPSLSELAGLYKAGQATFFHAVASPYRDRSHFDGQNVLETGGSAPYVLKDGWMSRLLAAQALPGKEAIAFATTIPAAMRGDLAVQSYAPSSFPQASDDLLMRVGQLYGGDAQLQALWSAAMNGSEMAAGMGKGARRQNPAELGRVAASFLARKDGPRIAMIETSGWDTHSAQNNRLATQLDNLNGLVAALRQGLGPVWEQTVILVATEFGRTVAANGTGGTDHGTGAAAMLLGGAVQGGRIIADWPGLAPGNLLDGRDLQPTLALDGLIAQTCAEVFKSDPQRLKRVLFPDSAKDTQLPRLLKA
jgi:uncharacterized protein (DUF1501 family)